jgi:hypothetical protein
VAFELARDEAGLKQALMELFEESLASARMASSLETSDEWNRERMLSSLPQRKLSPGFYRFGGYLLWLERGIQVGAPIDGMTSFEATGLRALSEARNEFERKHPPCGRCGELQDGRFVLMCWNCGMEFNK